MMSALVRALTSAEEKNGNISKWPPERLTEFREAWSDLLMERERTTEKPELEDSASQTKWDPECKPLLTEKYENYVVLRLYMQGKSRQEIMAATGLKTNKVANALQGRLRRRCKYITKDHHIFESNKLPNLVKLIRNAGLDCPSAGRVNRIIHADSGNYTYHGSYLGKFMQVTYVRRVWYTDAKTGKTFKGED